MINSTIIFYSTIIFAFILLSSSTLVNIVLVNNTDTSIKVEINGEIKELNANERKSTSIILGNQDELIVRGFLSNMSSIPWSINCRIYGQNYKLEINVNKEYDVLVITLSPLPINVSVDIVHKKIIRYAVGSGLSMFIRTRSLNSLNISKSILYSLNNTRSWNTLSITSLNHENGGILVNVNVDRGRFPFIDVEHGILEIQLNSNRTCILIISLPQKHSNNTTNNTTSTISNGASSPEYPYTKISTKTNNYINSYESANTISFKYNRHNDTITRRGSNGGISLLELMLLVLFALMFSIYMFLEYWLRRMS